MTSRPVVRFLLVDVLYPVLVVALVVGVLSALQHRTWQDAATYGLGFLAFQVLMVPVRAYRRRHPRTDDVSEEEYDLLHYRPASKRQPSA